MSKSNRIAKKKSKSSPRKAKAKPAKPAEDALAKQRNNLQEEVKVLSRFPSENPNPVMRISKDGTIQYCNRAGLPILNEWKCQVGQLVPDDWRQLVADVFASGIRKEFEERHDTQTFLMMLAPIVDEGYVNVYGRDITERKKAEEEIILAKNEWERTFDSMPDLVAILDTEHRIVQANKAMAQRLGTTPDQCVGLNCFKCVHKLDAPPSFCPHSLTMADGKEHIAEVHEPNLGGDFLVSTTPLVDQQGKIIGSVHVARDITERKAAVESLRKAHEELEIRVEERTKELRDASEKLQAENAERKRAEESVKAERKRFIDVLEKLPAYLVLLTPDYHVSYANRFFRERFGEDKGRRCFEYLFNRSEPCEICETYKTLKKMGPLEWEWTGPDGHNYYIYDSPFTNVDGSTLIMEVGIDITERKKAEEALRKAHDELETRVKERTRELKEATWKLQADTTERKKTEDKLQETSDYLGNLLNYANAPIIVWDPEFKITKFNHAFEHLSGYKAEEVLSKHLSMLFPEESREESLTEIEHTSAGEYWEGVEIPILRKDGDVRTVLWNSSNIHAADGKTLMATMAQGQDISERKKAEKALHDSQIDLNRAQTVAKTGSWRLNVPSNELLWSDETYRMFGIPKGTPLSYETFLNFVHPEDRGHVDQAWQAALRGEPYDIEHRIIVDGRVKWVREKAEMELNKDGALVSGFGTVQDVTEKREMLAKLEEYSQHLENLVAEKTQKLKEAERLVTIGETAGMVGHDIRNPLQSIEGAVYLAREELKALPDGSPEKKELYQILEMIRHQTNYIDNIVADLQDFSRTPLPQLRITDLHELVAEALTTTEIPESIQIQTQIQDDLKAVTVDPVFIKRVFLNLIENAAHAMPKGGKLTIKAFCENECTCIHVEDTGVGISEEDKPKIFTPLFTTKAKGQGFGLAVCKKLVEAHNGEIGFESEAGKGTVFKIRLPQRKEVV